MSKLQKPCPNYYQVCTLDKPGGCLYTVPWSTPQVSPPLGAQFLCLHQTSLREYLALTPRYWFAYLPAYYRVGVAKRYEAWKRLFATQPKPRLPLPQPTKSPDENSGNRRDSNTPTTGPTLTTVAPAFEG